jgi:hypothetical protein
LESPVSYNVLTAAGPLTCCSRSLAEALLDLLDTDQRATDQDLEEALRLDLGDDDDDELETAA